MVAETDPSSDTIITYTYISHALAHQSTSQLTMRSKHSQHLLFPHFSKFGPGVRPDSYNGYRSGKSSGSE